MLILLFAGIALALAIALLIPRYLVYVSDQTKKIREEREQDAELNVDRIAANMDLDNVSSTAVRYQRERGRFPQNAAELAEYDRKSFGIFHEAGKTGVNDKDSYSYSSDGQHFVVVMQVGGKGTTEYFCEDDSRVIRTGTNEPQDRCIGKPIPPLSPNSLR